MQIETRLNEKRSAAGKDMVYLTATNKPLQDVIALPSTNMFEDDDVNSMFCESGYCMT
jgi:hypothetical protein